MATKQLKRGPMARKEREYLERMHGRMTVEQMALKLRRSPEQVEKCLAELGQGTGVVPAVASAAAAITSRPEWKNLTKKFREDELEFFAYRFNQLTAQFGVDDILQTEEMQIFQIIELEIMDNATMAERKLLAEQQRICHDDLELNYDKLRKTSEATDAYERLTKTIQDLERRYASLAQQLKENGGRHDSYLMRINNVLKDLKGTREQRVKSIETGKTSFVGLLKMLQDEDRRNAVGMELAVHQAAEAKEQVRLSQLHTYMDGISDQPILTAETAGAFPAPLPSAP